MKLSESVLPRLPEGIAVPAYDRAALTAGIVHIGVGHFHRAHQAMYLDRLLAAGETDWAIWGIGVRSGDALATRLVEQDCLYTLTAKHPDGSTTSTVIGSIIGYTSAAQDGEAAIARLADPATKIISLTVTEGGYGIDAVTGAFSGRDDERITADLADPTSHRSWLGLVVQGLRRRRDTEAGPVTLMSCDNMQDNGHVTRTVLTGFVDAVAPDLRDWVEANMTFPNSMVDRVVPGTTAEDRERLRTQFDLEDAWPVTGEPFAQWVVQDDFAAGRPPLETVGVDVVDAVEPYEIMKLRLANGNHQASCFFGYLLGYEFVHEAIADPDIHAMLLRYIDTEAVPTLQPIPGVDMNAWGRTVLERFGNPQLRDPITRICEDTSNRIPRFLLPTVRDQLAQHGPVTICAAVVAGWARYAQGTDEQGRPIDVQDPRSAVVTPAARAESTVPGSFLGLTEIFGDLGDRPAFADRFREAFAELESAGTRALVRRLAG
ncbi:mannitol dehydrogenase family protein [Nakamurella flavida]|uniref:Mannitol-1-phosphate 5-dehydrogenase n=1 Tax=Nakamurella flavida TaxID=363630 RepID=A0A938YNS8_9ACTN|nr:mannitol dehydrogenase family protein [Nakamurella flavida]MBM9476757.1 mannitol dehydrogenase family protein [Nakamurella flavida]MDP9778805.1 mannitol 2-dehydrogenase [Nakamurella flavida]